MTATSLLCVFEFLTMNMYYEYVSRKINKCSKEYVMTYAKT